MKLKYKLYMPGGNCTALVEKKIDSLEIRKKINDEIMKKHHEVEQVGFISTDTDEFLLEMAGGEFCGNATRSATMFYLGGCDGEIMIDVSGVNRKLNSGIKNGVVWTEMPVINSLNSIKKIDENCFLVEMEGISHIVICNSDVRKEKRMYYSTELLERNNLMDLTAAGVVFLDKHKADYSIHPYVHVKSVDTMFYETACGSGTTAAGLVLAKLKGMNINEAIKQPSGHSISVKVDCEKKIKVIISGTVDIMPGEYEVFL